jgi:hypothetical protein
MQKSHPYHHKKVAQRELDRHIRCKCGKFWGLQYFKMKKECGRCRSLVKARGK